MTTYVKNGNLSIPILGGTLTVTPKGVATFTDAGGASVSRPLPFVKGQPNLTIPLGALKMTYNSEGGGSYSFKSGLVSGKMKFDGNDVTNVELKMGAGSYDSKRPDNAYTVGLLLNFDRNLEDGWDGRVSYGVQAKESWTGWPLVGGMISGVNSYLGGVKEFDPVITDPCSILGGAVGNACTLLQDAAANGGMSKNEVNAMNEAFGLPPVSVVVPSDPTRIFGNKGSYADIQKDIAADKALWIRAGDGSYRSFTHETVNGQSVIIWRVFDKDGNSIGILAAPKDESNLKHTFKDPRLLSGVDIDALGNNYDSLFVVNQTRSDSYPF